MPHQKKGGIHESNRIFMGPFGWYRLTEAFHSNICGARSANKVPPLKGGIFFPKIVVV